MAHWPESYRLACQLLRVVGQMGTTAELGNDDKADGAARSRRQADRRRLPGVTNAFAVVFHHDVRTCAAGDAGAAFAELTKERRPDGEAVRGQAPPRGPASTSAAARCELR